MKCKEREEEERGRGEEKRGREKESFMNIQGSLNKLELLKNTFSNNKKYQSENVIIEVWYGMIK